MVGDPIPTRYRPNSDLILTRFWAGKVMSWARGEDSRWQQSVKDERNCDKCRLQLPLVAFSRLQSRGRDWRWSTRVFQSHYSPFHRQHHCDQATTTRSSPPDLRRQTTDTRPKLPDHHSRPPPTRQLPTRLLPPLHHHCESSQRRSELRELRSNVWMTTSASDGGRINLRRNDTTIFHETVLYVHASYLSGNHKHDHTSILYI